MFGATTDASTAYKRKADSIDNPTFTFREARKALKLDSRSSRNTSKNHSNSRDGVRKTVVRQKNTGYADLRLVLTKLGVGEREREEYISLCETLKVGTQVLNKTSLRTLFGSYGDSGDFSDHERLDRFYSDENDDDMGLGGDVLNGKNDRVLFLRPIDAGGTTTTTTRGRNAKKHTQVLGSKHVYFITIMVGVSHSCFTNGSVGQAKATGKSDSVICLCLPPANTTSQHSTKMSDQSRLADLMIRKLYFVVRYIYETLRGEIKRRRAVQNGGVQHQTSRHYLNDCRFPAIVIKYAAPQNSSSPSSSTWYKQMKEKINRGEDLYTRCLLTKYRCNVL